MKKINKSEVKRILVITLSNIGDIILTTPVVEALLAEFPGADLDVMAGPNGEDIFKHHEKLRDVIIYNKKSLLFDKFKLFIKLRRKKYDVLVDLKHTVLPLVLGAKYISKRFRYRSRERHHKKDIHLTLVKEMGVDISKGAFYIPIKEEDKKHVDSLLGDTKDFITVSPGAKSHVKRWPLKNFAKLCDMIKNDLHYEIILIGDEYDRIAIERILFYMKTKPVNLIEKTNIRELAHLIKKSKLLITNDSAPLHVGSAVGANVLVFFGPTDEKKYGPLTQAKSRVLRKNIDCSPCETAQCINLGNKYECLKTISVDEAFRAVKELL